ncbi:hypothetical protein BDF20DRAFT_836132 [Mycotypha africana]|uniref:uncharacterized protein n=1 Tax=Mycotypha africana TaxID=64632 RepID=UPI0023006D40|nr:uncharacterized protein BDF20DRAFT_836132 [Mycotypha africana]KAI8977315.1 hypothetical protein BDF20DRAFT_836132 [Mycotypha africana]
MSSSNTQQNDNQTSEHFFPQHDIPAEGRDPIMQDDHFSLRFGNPIQVIHDFKTHKADTFEPTKEHVPGALADAIGNALSKQQQQQQQQQQQRQGHQLHHHHHLNEQNGVSSQGSSPALSRSNSGFLRDPILCADFYHTKSGAVSEKEHEEQH